jgi:predicted TIM-barrel fold metal-dependent hydrolase
MSSEKKNYVVISSDTHCGADLLDYKPYLESRYHDEFDAWAPTFADPWADYDSKSALDDRVGLSSFMADVNWDSPQRVKRLEQQGIAAEVCFPNTVPPFFPSGVISAASPGSPPANRHEYELRFAGLRAHNRWVADFCRAEPGRRAGLAQVFLSDVDDTMAEVRRAREDGLVSVLLPADHVNQLQSVYYARYEPLWSLLEDLGMSIGRHGVLPTEPNSAETGHSAAIGNLEALFMTRRILNALIVGGIFERHPRLKFITTEACGAWAPSYLAGLDAFLADAAVPGSTSNMLGDGAAKELKKKPSEYFADNCYVGSFLTDADISLRHEIGVERIMWGSDFPHHEGTNPYTWEAYRRNFSAVPEDEVRLMLGVNAAKVYGFDLDFLQPIADRIGPSVDEVARPLTDKEVPSYPDETVCATFIGDFVFDVS